MTLPYFPGIERAMRAQYSSHIPFLPPKDDLYRIHDLREKGNETEEIIHVSVNVRSWYPEWLVKLKTRWAIWRARK